MSDNDSDDYDEGEALFAGSADVKKGDITDYDDSKGFYPCWRKSRYRFYIELMILSVGIASLVGCVIAIIGLASSLVGKKLGNYSSGLLYLLFTLSCIPAPAFVKVIGPKWGLLVGGGLYAAYSIGNMIFRYTEEDATVVARVILLVSSALGGMGSTVMWTSQGTYMTTIAEGHSLSRGMERAKALGSFNGVFVALLQTAIVASNVISSNVLRIKEQEDANGNTVPADKTVTSLYTFYVVIVLAATALLCLLPQHKALLKRLQSGPSTTVIQKLAVTFTLMVNDPKVALMIPSNMAFGFVQGFQLSVFYGTIVNSALGSSNVGNVAAIIGGTGAIVAFPLGKLSDALGTVPTMTIGAVCYIAAMSTLVATHTSYDADADSIGDDGLWLQGWGTIVPVGIALGIGNAVWNTTNSAVFGRFFSEEKEAAFANLKLWSGIATAIGLLYLATQVNPLIHATIALVFSVLGIAGYYIAEFLEKRKRLAARQYLQVQ
mmetsp:Transcript_17218/g.48461  ORF Transcript_17218/g.48461 Transcript_17218/m.48461 type:complete len:491 (+) Transcript_17218:131-1603(+)